MPYEIDHEVAVELKDAGATASGHEKKVTIVATSLEHEISKILVWSGQRDGAGNKRTKEIDAKTNLTNTTVKFKDTHDSEIKNAHQVRVGANVKDGDWPICVDVYEAGTQDGEPPDVHRQGWFDANLEPVAAKEHPVEQPAQTWKKPFYPTMAEEPVPASGTLSGPDPYEKPPKAKKK